MGGKQLDLALKKVMFRNYCYLTYYYILTFVTRIVPPEHFLFDCVKASLLYNNCFYGSIIS